ncbi:hypothetical protein LVJ94_35205 [Pendulispora rubella]|uniref:Uncharacterized protein n=1 Tax=Pendulispora rubella TaxID=2741070 RepID=A0ABZ2KTX8_9BACT
MTNTIPPPPPTQLPIQTIDFVHVEESEFIAEYGICGEDIVFHFFLPQGRSLRYWTRDFPKVLEPVARRVFRADFPRICAMHIVEPELGIDSWWFRAYGFGRLLNARGLAINFLAQLAKALAVEAE